MWSPSRGLVDPLEGGPVDPCWEILPLSFSSSSISAPPGLSHVEPPPPPPVHRVHWSSFSTHRKKTYTHTQNEREHRNGEKKYKYNQKKDTQTRAGVGKKKKTVSMRCSSWFHNVKECPDQFCWKRNPSDELQSNKKNHLNSVTGGRFVGCFDTGRSLTSKRKRIYSIKPSAQNCPESKTKWVTT